VTSKPDFKVMVLLLVFMQLTRDLFAIAKFLFTTGGEQLAKKTLKNFFDGHTFQRSALYNIHGYIHTIA